MQSSWRGKVFIIGDSTVANYNVNVYPQAGWGQVIQPYFDSLAVQVINRAIGGRSSRSFYQEGRFTSVLSEMQKGDYLLIQFGHNDRDSS
jgi:lysophospholipase L1-like esterase